MKKSKLSTYLKLFSVIIIIISIFVLFKYQQNEKSDIFIPALMYHNFDLNPDFDKITYTIKPDLFERHMKALKQSGYNTITVTQLNEHFDNNIPLPEKPILITFDDGKTNVYQHAYPVLKQLEMKGNMFLIVHTNQEHNNADYLNWTNLKEMYDDSVMDMQSHTYDLHHKIGNKPVIFKKLDDKSSKDYKARILDDFILSKALIEEHIGNEVTSIAYPYGQFDEDIEEIAKLAGYKQSYSTDLGMMRKSDSSYGIKRINVDGLCSEKRLLFEISLFKVLNGIFR